MKNFFEWKFYLSKTNNRKKVERLYKFYNESQYWSVEELKSYQHERFLEIFNFCKQLSPCELSVRRPCNGENAFSSPKLARFSFALYMYAMKNMLDKKNQVVPKA